MSRLDDTIRDALELDPDVDLEAIAYRETPGWDSVAHLQLLTALEEGFDLVFEPHELMGMTDYASIRRVVEGRAGHAPRDERATAD